MELPDLAGLIWLFEDEPTTEHPDLHWPVGLQTFRLRRGDIEVVFSLDPFPGDAYVSLYTGGQEISSLGRLRTVETLAIVKRDGYEGLELRFAGGKCDPLTVQARPWITPNADYERADAPATEASPLPPDYADYPDSFDDRMAADSMAEDGEY